ncbi:Dna2/Cas4 domain-containing protein [uncultured Methanobrevibacter sp.]|uniref:CRISPR-associated protein Cas4 n=1 Tax=uncultured Methanobrevibacter sp. TaxID=253161 RepID=UPI0025F2C66A|nr:Dna2/Cas4 domain-containing protein [uncultured Methanobrevibacter sp.]
MISLRKIKTYMYCPMQLYYQYNIHGDIENKNYEIGRSIKEIRLEIQDIIQRNLKRTNRNMSVADIEKELFKNVNYYINNRINELYDPEKYDSDDLEKYKNDLSNETRYNIKILALKAKRYMNLTNKEGNKILEILYPTSMYNYILKDRQLNISGLADKIEIINGKYFPIILKASTPPIKGVWENDSIELAFNSILIEEEFDTEVYVGFVEYVNLCERRPVIIDVNLRKSLFRILDHVRQIIINKEIPCVKYDENKCERCEFKGICLEE